MKKNRRTRRTILALCLATMCTACVDEYTIPKTTEAKHEAEVVIEGRILSGEESVVHVARTTPLGSEETSATDMEAQVHVVGENGYRSEAARYDDERGCHVIDTRTLTADTRYAVEVNTDGDTYRSEFQSLLSSPEISEVNWRENESSVSILVTTQADDMHSPNFMWAFEEDWEFHADVDMRGTDKVKPIYVEKHYPGLTESRNPYYYGWMHDVSKNIRLHSTTDLTENVVKDYELHEIGIDDIRISYIYSILVKQWSLTDEAYRYFETLKRYTEESEGLFAPVLSDYQGNVVCTSDPEKRAHGYVLASTVATKRIFIYEEDFEHLRSTYRNPECAPQANNHPEYWEEVVNGFPWLSPYVIMAEDADWWHPEAVLYNWPCVDCRHTPGASKRRPDFWPNNHE